MKCGVTSGESLRCNMNLAEARPGYGLAAAQGFASAQVGLGNMHLRGDGVPQDFAEARRLFGLAGAQGHAEAQEMSEMMGSTWWAGMHPA